MTYHVFLKSEVFAFFRPFESFSRMVAKMPFFVECFVVSSPDVKSWAMQVAEMKVINIVSLGCISNKFFPRTTTSTMNSLYDN
jgi:hypothetical protein